MSDLLAHTAGSETGSRASAVRAPGDGLLAPAEAGAQREQSKDRALSAVALWLAPLWSREDDLAEAATEEAGTEESGTEEATEAGTSTEGDVAAEIAVDAEAALACSPDEAPALRALEDEAAQAEALASTAAVRATDVEPSVTKVEAGPTRLPQWSRPPEESLPPVRQVAAQQATVQPTPAPPAPAPRLKPGFEEKKPAEPPAPSQATPRAGRDAVPRRRGGAKAAVAKPAGPPPLGDPTLDRWKTATTRATAATKAGPLPADGPDKVAAEGRRQADERAAQRPDFAAEAKVAQPKVPEESPKTETLDTGPADQALATLKAIGQRRLPEQTLAELGQPPAYPGLSPRDFVPATRVKKMTDLEERLTHVDLTPKERADLTAQLEQAKKDVAAIEEAATKATPEKAPPTVEDAGPASLEPLPPDQADVLGDAVARALGTVDKRAKAIVDRAVAKLHGATVKKLADDAAAKLPPVRDELDRELRGIAAAAGVTEEQLTAKVAEQKVEAAKEAADLEKLLAEKGVAATEQVNERGAGEATEIAGAKQAVDRENTKKKEAVSGPPDTSAIEGKRDEYLAKAAEVGAEAAAAVRAGRERREQDLDKAAGQQKAAAKQAADNQAAAIRRHWAADPDKATAEALATVDWGTARMAAVDTEVARLKKEAGAQADANAADVREGIDTAKEQVRDWAARQKGRERSWWDRLVDLFTDWFHQASADNSAWERQRNAESRDKMAADVSALMALKGAQVAGNRESLVGELSKLDTEQQKLAQLYFAGGISSIGFVAESTMNRISDRRVPELAATLESDAIATWDWESLGQLARVTNTSFDPAALGNKIRGGVEGWGTEEAAVYSGLEGARTAVERASLSKFYVATFGVSMEKDIDEDMDDHEFERAQALMSGDRTAAAAATIKEAVDGLGTDEEAIKNALRGKTREEVEAIKEEYRRRYHVELKTDLEHDMGGAELDVAVSLSEADVDAADAAELEDAMSGAGTDEEKLRMVYNRIREEEEKVAREQNLTPAELQARIKARNGRVEAKYNSRYGGTSDLTTRMTAELADLDESAVASATSRGSPLVQSADIKLMTALRSGDETQIDAMRALREHEGVYASDDELEAITRNQYKRADLTVTLELGAERARLAALVASGDLTREEFDARMKDWQGRKDKREETIAEKAKANMGALKDAYGKATGGAQSFDQLISQETSGYSQEEIQALVEAGGKLKDEEEIYYAIAGAGTDEDKLKKVLQGKTKAQVDTIRTEYDKVHGKGSFDSDILGDLSGREDLDLGQTLKHGDPDTFGQQLADAKTPAARQEVLAAMKSVLAERRDFESTGLIGGAMSLGGDSMNSAAQLELAVDRAEKYVAALEKAGDVAAEGAPPDLDVLAARASFEMTFSGAREAQEQVRKQIDSITDTVAQVGAAVVGIAVTIATAGAAGPAALAAAAAWGAAASAASSILIKSTLKGAAYSWEELGVDVAVGAVDVAVSAATAGIGGKVLGRMESLIQGMVAKQAAKEGAEELSEATLKAFLREAAEEAVENGLQGMPSAAVAAMLDDGTWKSGDPWGAIWSATGQAGMTGAGMGVGIHGATKGFGAVRGALKGEKIGGPAPKVEGPEAKVGGPEPRTDGPHLTKPELPVPPKGVDPSQVEIDLPPAADPPKAAEKAMADETVPKGALEKPDAKPRSPAEVDETIDLDDPSNAHLIEEIDGVDPRRPHVGDDGLVDLDDPRNAWLLEDRMAGQLPGPLARDPVASREFFEGFVKAQPQRESALLVNSVTGEHIVVQGGPDSVDVRRGHGVWESLIPSGQADVGTWELVVHSHPADASGLTPRNAYFPSGADGDFWYAVDQARRTGRAARQEIRVQTADGPAASYFEYDPARTKPYLVDIPGPGGTRQVHDFATMDDYHDFYKASFGGDMGPVPADFPGIKNADLDAADTQRMPRQSAGPDLDKPPPQPQAPKKAKKTKTTAPAGTPLATGATAPLSPSSRLEVGRPGMTKLFAAEPHLRVQLDDAVAALERATGGKLSTDALDEVLASFEATIKRDGGMGARRMRNRIAELELLAERVSTRSDMLDPGRQAKFYDERLAQAKSVRDLADRGLSMDGRTLEPGPRLERARSALDRLIAEAPTPRAGDPVASLVDLETWHANVRRAADRIRGLSESRFVILEYSTTRFEGAPEFLGKSKRVATVDVEVKGTLGDGILRQGKERVLLSEAKLAELDPQLAKALADWHRAHLVGPGFGSELAEGIAYGPPGLNLGVQNNGIERALRAMPEVGLDAEVHVRVQAQRYQLPGGKHVDVIVSVKYSVQRLDPQGLKIGDLRDVIINVGAPPAGTLDFGHNDFPGLTLDGFGKSQ